MCIICYYSIYNTLYLWLWWYYFAHSASVTPQSLTDRVGGTPVRLAAGSRAYSSFIRLPVILSWPWNLLTFLGVLRSLHADSGLIPLSSWYYQLPVLPCVIIWSSLLLWVVLYGKFCIYASLLITICYAI